MYHAPQQPEIDATGAETHPAFGMISASRLTYGGGQAVLFQSDVQHHQTVRITVEGATRSRDLSHDWVHPDNHPLIQVEMSEAQWASFVSSMNTTGVACTVRATQNDWDVPGLPYQPRLAESMAEVRGVAQKLFKDARAALAEYEAAVAEKKGAKVTREALRRLHFALENSESSVTFTADSLARHAEDVVQKARADIEAMVTARAARLGIEAGDQPLLELGTGADTPS